jgi:hypothetical protein
MPGFPMRMGTNVMLMWAPIPGATAYNIYKSNKVGEVGPLLISIPGNNHMDINVPSDKDAVYVVKAVIGGAEGDASIPGVLKGLKALDPPKFTGNMFSSGQLNVRWDPVTGAAFYNISRSDAKAGPFALLGSVQEPKYVDTQLTEGSTYFYQVSAVDKNNMESPKSEILEVVIKKTVKKVKRVQYTAAAKLVDYNASNWGKADDSDIYRGPSFLYFSEVDQRLYMKTSVDFIAADIDGNIVLRFKKPADYEGIFGIPGFMAIDETNGILWATYSSADFAVKAFSTKDGELVGEANLDFPEEDYIAEGREEDMKMMVGKAPQPTGIAVDGEGEIWIADAVYKQVVVFDTDFNRIARIGSPRNLNIENKAAIIKTSDSMTYDPKLNRVVLLDRVSVRLHPFDAAANDYFTDENGDPDYGWLKKGAGPGYSKIPAGINFDPDGNFMMVDSVTGSVFVYDGSDAALPYLHTLVTDAEEMKLKRVKLPTGVAVGAGRLYVSEMLEEVLRVFDLK